MRMVYLVLVLTGFVLLTYWAFLVGDEIKQAVKHKEKPDIGFGYTQEAQ